VVERILLLACCLLLPASTTAQPRPDQEKEAEDKKPWVELELKLPAFPKPENLLRFEPNAWSSNRFYIDQESISVASDGVARYTLVIRSAGGAENISYEGIRCETVEQKYYASGRRDGTWSQARSSEWRRIEYKEINRQHAVLYADYFCPDRKLIKSSRDAVNRFKYGVLRSGGGSS
jgi:hypothetical protein